MPYKTPLRKPKVRESVFAHTVKLCWFYVKFEDIHDKITLKKFCDDFEEMVVIGGIGKKSYQNFTSTVTYTKKMEPSTNLNIKNYLERKDGLIFMTGNPNILFLKQIC